VRLVVNATTGAVAQRLDYDEWGVVTADTSPGFQPFGFAGGMQDPTTHLVHFGARDYSPQLGRWITKDPSGMAGGVNLFGYAAGDPLDFIDADGAHPVIIAVATGASVYFAPSLGQALWTAGGALLGPVIGKGLGWAAGRLFGQAAGEAGAACGAAAGEAAPAAEGEGISLAQSMAQGLVRRGGKLEQVLGSIEQEFAAARPSNPQEAMAVVSRATDRVSLGYGVPDVGPNGETILLNAGNITTTIGLDGSIVVARGPDILLHLLP
jgi:RHS repeat-associated protein